MSAPSGRLLARRAHDLVVDWVVAYTRGLDGSVARDRFDEVVSDLWEQAAASDRAGRSSLRFALSLLLRALRGVPADLSWRHARVQRGAVGAGRSSRRAPARPLATLVGPPLFDQTNGVVAADQQVVHERDDAALDLLSKGVASNIVNVGFPFN